MPQTIVTAFRHGVANYAQKQVLLSEADDLTEAGIKGVIHSVEKLASEIGRDEKVFIVASPYGRTLQTATIIFDILNTMGFSLSLVDPSGLVSAENVIVIDDAIDEIRNFDLNLFSAFVYGGEMDGAVLSKGVTNPKGLSFREYFNGRAWIDVGVKAPKRLIALLEQVEHPEDTSQRLVMKLREIEAREFLESARVILVTHQGVMSGLSADEVHPADFITVSL